MTKQGALQIGIIGLGQCGGNFAAEFAAKGYPALAINTSPIDLRALRGLEEAQRLFIGSAGMNGTGGNLTTGLARLEAARDAILAAATALEVEVFLVVGGLGGGTGGGLGAVVQLLSTLERPVIAWAVLPAGSDNHAAKLNALQAVNALLDAPFDSLAFVDNQKLSAAFANAGIDQYLHEANAAVVTAFDDLNRLHDRADLASIRTFGPEELRQTLLSGGVSVFGSRILDGSLTAESLLVAARETLGEPELFGGGYDLTDLVTASSIVTAHADVLADTPATVFEDFYTDLKQETGGAAHHGGIYQGEEERTRVYFLAGGFPLPARLGELVKEATEEAARFKAKAAPRSKLKKLDLSALGGLVPGAGPPAAGVKGKGMVKHRGRVEEAPAKGGADPLVDLDFDDGEPPVIEENLEAPET
jgi:cell division GTPase FtsZ